MIVSDTERFVFVHNPKCGGMACRTRLAPFDTRDNFFFEWKPVCEGGKVLDMAHITPFQLRRFFPQAFGQVAQYVKFGFVRDPYARFLSAISQHLKLATPAIRKAILSEPDLFYRFASSFALNVLDMDAIENDHRLVHFRPQVHFHNLDGQRWTDFAFKLEQPETMQGTPVAKFLPNMSEVRNKTQGYSESGYETDRLSPQAIGALTRFYDADFGCFAYRRH